MAKRPAIMFYTGDWMKDPHLATCSPATRGIWIDMLCLMHENSESGKLTGTVLGLSRACRCTPDELLLCLNELHQSGTSNITPLPIVTQSHSVVTVSSRRMMRESDRRKASAERQKQYRDRHRDGGVTDDSQAGGECLSSSSSVSSSNAKKKRSVLAIYDDPDFQAFWQCAYRKTGKGSAARFFDKACRDADPATILKAWAKQNEQWRREKAEKQYVPHPSTWLNGGRWEDELAPASGNGKDAEPAENLEGRLVEIVGGPANGAKGRVVQHRGTIVEFYDADGFRHKPHQDEIKVIK